MFLAMHNWMRAEPIEVTIRRMVECGYKSIEIEGETTPALIAEWLTMAFTK